MSDGANRLEIGKTLSAMTANFAANIPALAGLVAVAGLAGGMADTLSPRAGNMAGNIILFFVSLYATLKALRTRCGDDPDIQPHGGRAFGINFLSGFGIIVGFLLLIVPGLMLFTRWAVALPAMMREDLGVSEALGRSRDLTDGSRWTILGLALIIWVPFFLAVILFGGLAGVFAGEGAMASLFGNIVINLAIALMATFSSILWVETYVVLAGEVKKDELVEIFA